MTPRQQKFAEYYAESGNIVQAALRAGYSESYANSRAHELLEHVGVAEYIRKIGSAQQENRILSATKRQEILSSLATDPDNEPKDRIRAIDTLNKMTGEYTMRVDASVQPSAKLADVMAQIGGKGLTDGD